MTLPFLTGIYLVAMHGVSDKVRRSEKQQMILPAKVKISYRNDLYLYLEIVIIVIVNVGGLV